jgi:serine/threonine-protein kinase
VRDFAEALQGTATFVAAPPPVRSLLVIPFANQGGDADTEFLSDGLSEELIHTLNALEGLRVVGRTSAFSFKGTTEDVREIGRRLGVEVVLEGSVRRAGRRLRITAQLTGVSDGLQIWSERFEREVGDAFLIQDEIAAAILAALRLTLLGRSPPRVSARTDNPRAYELYLRGRHSWNSRTETGLHRSVAFLKDAIEADAGFALAGAALAESYVTLGVYGAADPREVMPLAEAAATAALEKDFRLAEAHGALGSVQALYHWRWADAEASYRRALSANPSAGLVRHGFAVHVLLPQGRWDQARSELERARALEPLAPAIALSLGLIPYYQGDFPAAEAVFREVVATDEHFAMSHFFLGQTVGRLGRFGEAGQALERAQLLAGPSPEILAARAWLQAVSGSAGAARAELERLLAMRATRYVSPVLEARVLAALEETEAALDAVTRAVEGRAADTVWLGAGPISAGLRDEPRFRALLARMGLGAG